MALGGLLGLVRQRMRIRILFHSSSHRRFGLGISVGIFTVRTYLWGGSFPGLEILLKRGKIYGKV